VSSPLCCPLATAHCLLFLGRKVHPAQQVLEGRVRAQERRKVALITQRSPFGSRRFSLKSGGGLRDGRRLKSKRVQGLGELGVLQKRSPAMLVEYSRIAVSFLMALSPAPATRRRGKAKRIPLKYVSNSRSPRQGCPSK